MCTNRAQFAYLTLSNNILYISCYPELLQSVRCDYKMVMQIWQLNIFILSWSCGLKSVTCSEGTRISLQKSSTNRNNLKTQDVETKKKEVSFLTEKYITSSNEYLSRICSSWPPKPPKYFSVDIFEYILASMLNYNFTPSNYLI